MNIFNETLQLAKMLFTDVDSEHDVKLIPMDHYPFKGYKYMMWCGNIIYRTDDKDGKNIDIYNMNHEMIHVEQAKDEGSWIKYYIKYFIEKIKLNPFTKKSYYLNKFEVEAYAKMMDLSYVGRRKIFNVDLFVMTDYDFIDSFSYKIEIREMFKNI